jgi:oxygen-independent coproporphyrinogen III oxidase
MRNLSSLYIHFPYCLHLCNYCDFFRQVSNDSGKIAKKEDLSSFHSYLDQSITKHDELLNKYNFKWNNLETIFIGGGTPSLWGEQGASYFKRFINQKNISFSKDYEFTLEVNPSAHLGEGLNRWKSEAGVNRFSIGLQSLREDFMKILDRYHGVSEVHSTLNLLRNMNANFSVDFMLGLPFSKEKSRDVIEELKEILDYEPKHLSLYILTVKNNYKYFKNLPCDSWIEDEYLKVSEFLKGYGFNHYEVSNFSLDGLESKHNLKYWENKTVYALGPSATGFLRVNKDNAVRYKWNTKKSKLDLEHLTRNQLALEDLYLGLRTFKGYRFLGKSLDEKTKSFQENLHYLSEKNYLRESYENSLKNKTIKLNSRGFLMLDSVIENLFEFLEKPSVS